MSKELLCQVPRFCVSGGAGVAVYYIGLYTLTEFAHVWYVLSAIIAFVLNFLVNFTLMKLWTFRGKGSKEIKRQLVTYFIMAIGFLVANTTLLYVLVEYAHIQYLVAQGVLTVFLSIASFFITRKIFTN
ncbi:MAG: hypothetical protein A3A22_02310 [Candidatus Taylorbacteria bacterium RIFCSPLOWO2_01_FULL_45_34b]|nr:MAG: hypothetical protein A3A22_02310 [Candidatus Taylorbacteria bacterium RIFCSPLOWO2_01_FULL_45_34b]